MIWSSLTGCWLSPNSSVEVLHISSESENACEDSSLTLRYDSSQSRGKVFLPLPAIHSFQLASEEACACHLAPFSSLRVYVNTNPPKKGKIFPFSLLWIKFQQTWLRIRHALQIKECRRGGAEAGAEPKPSSAFGIITSPHCWTEVLSKGYSLFG